MQVQIGDHYLNKNAALEQFSKNDAPILEFKLGDCYKKTASARSSWFRVINKHGYQMRVTAKVDGDAIYIIKTEKE